MFVGIYFGHEAVSTGFMCSQFFGLIYGTPVALEAVSFWIGGGTVLSGKQSRATGGRAGFLWSIR
jgi:hypothetical protein